MDEIKEACERFIGYLRDPEMDADDFMNNCAHEIFEATVTYFYGESIWDAVCKRQDGEPFLWTKNN